MKETELFYEQPFTMIGRKMKLLVDTGRLLLEKGSDTNHLIRDVKRAAVFMGMHEDDVHVHVTHNTVMVAITTEDRSYTSFTKTTSHSVDMTKLSALSKLSWRALENRYTLDEYEAELERIEHIPSHYPLVLRFLSAGMACAGFSILFGSSYLAAMITAVCATIAYAMRRACEHLKFNGFINIAIAAFVATALAGLSCYVVGDITTMTYAMICASLFLIPGVPLMNAVNDLLNGFTISGVGRAVFTLLIVGFLTFGIVVAIHLQPQGNISQLPILPTFVSPIHIIAGGISALGFSTLFNTPVRLLPFVTCGGALAVAIRNILLVSMSFGLVSASLVATIVISVVMIFLAKKGNTAVSVLSIPSVIPLIPGVLLYRFAYAIMQINGLDPNGFLQAEQAGFTGIITIFCMTIGVATPTLFGSSIMNRDKSERVHMLVEARRKQDSLHS